jgi:NADH-quinone oxidoreductase subunit A
VQGYLAPYVPILILLALAGVLCAAITFLAGFLGPKRIFAVKETAFECGSPTTGDPHARHSVKFYLVALLFIVFDIESVFIYPWGALLRDFVAEGRARLVRLRRDALLHGYPRRRPRLRVAQGRARVVVRRRVR